MTSFVNWNDVSFFERARGYSKVCAILVQLAQRFFRESLHFLRKMAVSPSGPEADELESSSIAAITSSSVMSISVIVGTFGSSIIVSYGLGEGLLKTEEYWEDSISAISKELEVYSFNLLRSGPILLRVVENCFA